MWCQVNNLSLNNETTYREEVGTLTVWCQVNNLSLNISKAKKLIVDFRRNQAGYVHVLIIRAAVETVKNLKFLCVPISEELKWSNHTDTVAKTATLQPQEAEEIQPVPVGPHSVLQERVN